MDLEATDEAKRGVRCLTGGPKTVFGRLAVNNVPLRTIILRAYDLHDTQLIGAPEWTAIERFDIDARAASPPLDGPGALVPMLRPLLAERFALKARMETRELPAYVLVHARRDRQLGKQIRPTAIDCEAGRNLTQEPGTLNDSDSVLVPVRLRHSEPADCFSFEIELNQHDRLGADDPAVVTRVDGDDLRRPVLDDAAVGVFDVDLPVREKADVRMHAEVGTHDRLHVHGPAESGRVDRPLDTRRTGAPHVQPHMSDFTAFRAGHSGHQRVRPGNRAASRRLATLRSRLTRGAFLRRSALLYFAGRLLNRLARGFFLGHVSFSRRSRATRSAGS